MFEVRQNEKYGVVVSVKSSNLADEFDDFLAENFYVQYEQKFHRESVDFFFGQVSSMEKVEKLISCYCEKNGREYPSGRPKE